MIKANDGNQRQKEAEWSLNCWLDNIVSRSLLSATDAMGQGYDA